MFTIFLKEFVEDTLVLPFCKPLSREKYPENTCFENVVRDDTNMTFIKIVQFSRPLSPPCPSTSKILPPP